VPRSSALRASSGVFMGYAIEPWHTPLLPVDFIAEENVSFNIKMFFVGNSIGDEMIQKDQALQLKLFVRQIGYVPIP
jgi:hypothetical protein